MIYDNDGPTYSVLSGGKPFNCYYCNSSAPNGIGTMLVTSSAECDDMGGWTSYATAQAACPVPGCCAVCDKIYPGEISCSTITCPSGMTCQERPGQSTRCVSYVPVNCDPNEPWNYDWSSVECPAGADGVNPYGGQLYSPCPN